MTTLTSNFELSNFDLPNLNLKLSEIKRKHKENIVMTGSYIRSVLLEEYNDIKQEIFISSITDINWKDILPESYEETETMFLKKVNNNHKHIPFYSFDNFFIQFNILFFYF